ncbi:MAG: TspO/MBR family protein [Cyclobacteriaceae bacterium]
MILRFIIFLIINFAALGLGSLFTSSGVSSDWYQNLNKAPWTPPGWVFGAAWTTIMICFSGFMTFAWTSTSNRNILIALFICQWILNVVWNPLFFKYHAVLAGLVAITSLTLVVGYFLFSFTDQLKLRSLLVAPYFLWLLIATSLNGYILWNN